MEIAIVVVAILVVVLLWYISISNRFARIAVKIKESESGIDVALIKRYDTLTKMLDVCRKYAIHETDAFEKIIKLRQNMSMSQRQEAIEQMDEMVGKINVLAEGYPELKSSEVFQELQKGIRDVEEHLQASRRFYNANVSILNQLLGAFPQSIVGRQKGLKPVEFFEAEENKRVDVEIEI